MALSAAIVQQYTQGRLDKDDAETQRLLDAALAAARRWCGWHVTPVEADVVVTLDGRGGRMLRLPTMQLVALTALVEDGVSLDVDNDVYVSALGMVEKKTGLWWTCRFGGIVATMTHGFAAAPDFEAAVLSLVDRESLVPSGGRVKASGPFQFDLDPIGTNSPFTVVELAKLEQFRLERPA